MTEIGAFTRLAREEKKPHLDALIPSLASFLVMSKLGPPFSRRGYQDATTNNPQHIVLRNKADLLPFLETPVEPQTKLCDHTQHVFLQPQAKTSCTFPLFPKALPLDLDVQPPCRSSSAAFLLSSPGWAVNRSLIENEPGKLVTPTSLLDVRRCLARAVFAFGGIGNRTPTEKRAVCVPNMRFLNVPQRERPLSLFFSSVFLRDSVLINFFFESVIPSPCE